MASCYQGAITCSVEDGTARTERARLEHRTPPESGPVRTCELDMVTCSPEAAFGFHGAVRARSTEIRTKCQWRADEEGVVLLAPLKIWNPAVIESNYLNNAIPVPQVGRAVYSNPRDCTDPNQFRTGSNMAHQPNLAWQGVPDVARTCLRLGTKDVVGADTSGCAQASESALCEYPRDVIAGGCETPDCVRDGLRVFVEGAERVVRASAMEGARRNMQDALLASLVQGLRDGVGDCGDAGVSCLAKLRGDCAELSAAASVFQELGRPALYKALKDASETCIADAGLRERPG
jgi:hypothetical protein